MIQLNIFEYLVSVEKKNKEVKKICKAKKSSTKKPSKRKPKADLVISMDRKGKFFSNDEVGLVKLQLLNRSGATKLRSIGDFNVIHFVRGDHASDFKELEDSVIRFAFSSEAEKKIKRLRKNYERRNIPLKIDVTEVMPRV